MSKLSTKFGVVVMFCAMAAGWAFAQEPATKADSSDEWAASRLGKTELGELWMGPDIDKEDLRGQVVLLEFWGCHCGPCIASIPHISKLNTKYAKGGLVVIGAHAQGPLRAEACAIASDKGANYTILASAQVPDAKFDGVPHVFVFNHKGEVVFEGHPSDNKMEQAIVAALKDRPHPLLGDRKYKAMAAAVTKIKSGKLGEAWNMCKEKAEAEGDAGEEAAFLMANLDRYAKHLADKAEKSQGRSPALCKALLMRLKKEMAGAPYEDDADKKLKELAEDKTFMMELKAEAAYAPIAKALLTVPPYPEKKTDQDTWARKYGGTVKNIKSNMGKFKKKFPDSMFVASGEEYLKEIAGEAPEPTKKK